MVEVSGLAGQAVRGREVHPQNAKFIKHLVYSLFHKNNFLEHFFMHFCPMTITTYADSINSDLQRGLDRRLRHIQH